MTKKAVLLLTMWVSQPHLKQAMNDYTARDKKNYGDTDVAKVAYPEILRKAVCMP